MANKLDFQSQIKLEPIRRHAEAFGMNTPLPKTQAEYVAKLYEFGFRLNGQMEEMVNRALKLQDDLMRLSAAPTFTVPRITEARSDD